MSYEEQYRAIMRSLAAAIGEKTALTVLRGWREVQEALRGVDTANGQVAAAWRLAARHKAIRALGYTTDICQAVLDVDPDAESAQHIRQAADQVRRLVDAALASTDPW